MSFLPPHVRAVFFDAVGTVLFPSPGAPSRYAEVAGNHCLELPVATIRDRFVEAYKTQELIDRAADWITSEGRERDRWHSIVTATLRGVSDPEACFHELYEYFARPASWKIGRDVGTVIAGLVDRGIVVGLGSNYDGRLWSVLDGFPELALLRERTVISSILGRRKPAVQFFREIVRLAGCEPGEVLFVGDDVENDYVGATAAGLDAALFDDRNRYGSLKRITQLTELLA